MSFSTSCQNWRLEGSVLCAQARRADGSWTDGRLDLNRYVGNNDGQLDYNGQNVYETADKASWRIEGTDIVTLLYKVDGSFGSEQRVRLNDHVSNNNGELEWRN